MVQAQNTRIVQKPPPCKKKIHKWILFCGQEKLGRKSWVHTHTHGEKRCWLEFHKIRFDSNFFFQCCLFRRKREKENKQLCRQEKEFKTTAGSFPNPKRTKENSRAHSERHVDQLRQTQNADGTDKMEKKRTRILEARGREENKTKEKTRRLETHNRK